MIPAWIAANATRILVYLGLAVALAMFFELDGFRRGELKLYDYQAKEAAASVALVVKTNTIVKDADDSALMALQSDYGELGERYAAARRMLDQSRAKGNSIPAAAPGNEAGCKIARFPDSVIGCVDENKVVEMIEYGDREIAKLRALYERDLRLSR